MARVLVAANIQLVSSEADQGNPLG